METVGGEDLGVWNEGGYHQQSSSRHTYLLLTIGSYSLLNEGMYLVFVPYKDVSHVHFNGVHVIGAHARLG